MSSKVRLELNFNSRFKRTNLFTLNGRTFFGLWRPPEIRMDGDEKEVVIPKGKEGSLDFLSHQEYGTRELFWAIALVNDIRNIAEEVTPGKRIKVPKVANVREALLAEGNQGATGI